MMLMGVEAKVSLSALIDVAEGMVQSMALPFAKSHGPLITTYLTAAKHWCKVEQANGKVLQGVDAAVHMMQSLMKADAKAKPDGKLVMMVAPCLQLLDVDLQKHLGSLLRNWPMLAPLPPSA